jgi:hypothetical protein
MRLSPEREQTVGAIERDMLVQFEKKREKNRQIAEEKGENDGDVELSLLEFAKHSQTPNDAYALRIRLNIILKFLSSAFGVSYEKSIIHEEE